MHYFHCKLLGNHDVSQKTKYFTDFIVSVRPLHAISVRKSYEKGQYNEGSALRSVRAGKSRTALLEKPTTLKLARDGETIRIHSRFKLKGREGKTTGIVYILACGFCRELL